MAPQFSPKKKIQGCHACYKPLVYGENDYCDACETSGAAERHLAMTSALRNGEPHIRGKRNLPLPPPTQRQLTILLLISQGKNQAEAGRAIGITESTVYKHLIYVKRKLNAKNTTEAIAIAVRDGLI